MTSTGKCILFIISITSLCSITIYTLNNLPSPAYTKSTVSNEVYSASMIFNTKSNFTNNQSSLTMEKESFESIVEEKPTNNPLRHNTQCCQEIVKEQYKRIKKQNNANEYIDNNENDLPYYIMKGSEEEKLWKQKKASRYMKTNIDPVEVHIKEAVLNGDIDVIANIIQKDVKAITDTDENGWKPIHEAVRSGREDIIKLLIHNGANINAVTNDGETTFMLATRVHGKNHAVTKFVEENGGFEITVTKAIANGDVDIVAKIIKKDREAVTRTDEKEWQPIHEAVRFGLQDVVELLLQYGADVNAKTFKCETPLMWALALHGESHPVVRVLKEQGGIVNKPATIHDAAVCGDIETVKKIFNQNSLAIHEMDENGWQPIHEASRNGRTHIVKFLVENGASVNAETKFGGTSLWWAEKENGKNHRVVRFLKEQGAKSIDPFAGAHRAAGHGNIENLKRLTKMDEFALDRRDSNGWEPLHEAAREGHTEVVKYLMQQNVNVNALTNLGDTPLMIALTHHEEHHPIVEILRDNGATIYVDPEEIVGYDYDYEQ